MERIKSHNIVEFIINKRKWIEKIFMVLLVISIICFPMIGINYDLTKYLPKTVPSKQGLDVMEDEFGYPGTARIMIKDVSIYEAKIYKDTIENIDGVDMVIWADTKTDVYQSSYFINYDDIEDYYKDGYSVMDITFDEVDSSDLTHNAIDEIQDLIGDKGYFSGASVEDKSLNETISREMSIAMVIGVAMVIIILCITTTSWFEPFLFILIMGIAIIINMGTNIIFGSISFLTFSVAAILQLAIAMDYSIFLLHSFTREKESGLEATQALANAIKTSTSSILSSGATTIVGFIVLAFMKLTIGKDIGFVLAKGIVISVLTVLLLMPALILRWHDKIESTSHRSFMPSFKPLGQGIYKMRYIILIIVLLITGPAYTAQNMNKFLYGNDALSASEGTKVYADTQEINKIFGRSNLFLVLVPNTSNVKEKDLASQIEDLYYVKSVTSLVNMLPDGIPESFLPKGITSNVHNEDYARMLVYVKSAGESKLSFEASDTIKKLTYDSYGDDSYVLGVTPSTQDIKETIVADYNFVNILSLIGVALVVLCSFKSVIIPIVVIIPIQTAIFINMSIPYILGDEMIYVGYIIVSCLQLGATVDYSILLTNNYLDFRMENNKKDSCIGAISKSALSIITSGTILTTVGYGLCFTSSIAAIASIGRLVGRGAIFSMILVLVLLPALLISCDKVIFDAKKRLAKIQKLHRMRQEKIRLTLKSRIDLRRQQILKYRKAKTKNQKKEKKLALKNQKKEKK